VLDKHYAEVALYQLKSGIDDAQFLAISDEATEVYRKLPGFVRRELMKSDEGKWVDLVYWQNRDLAKQAEPTIYNDGTIAKVMAVLDTESMIFTHAEAVRQDS
jgi:hypothetical protein